MKSLFSVSPLCFHVPNFSEKTPNLHPKSIFSPPDTQKHSNLSWRSTKIPKFRVFSSSSSTLPSVPELEVEVEEEKFDWFANWYPIAPVCDLDKRVPHAKTVMGLDVVVWWDKVEGRWQVFDDKCPHRLAPLSEGRIDQFGRLQCVYHGWCFDGSGNCKYIPQAPPDGPQVHTFRKACAASYPSFEQNKIVWFWPSTDPQHKDILTKEKPPYVPELDDPSYSCLMGMRDVPYGYEVLIENLMDPAHVPYAHYGLIRIPKSKTRADREGGKPLDITIQTLNIKGFFGIQERGYSKFIAPCLLHAIPHFQPESLENHQGNRRMHMVLICVPVGPGKSRLIWNFARNFSVWVDQLVPRWVFHLGQNLFLDSDLYLLHLEVKVDGRNVTLFCKAGNRLSTEKKPDKSRECKIHDIGSSNWQESCFVPTKSDALVVAFRKWLRKYSGSQIDWGSKLKGQLPPTPTREQLLDRYWSHVVQCSSCRMAVTGLKALEVSLQVVSIVLIGIVAAAKESLMSTFARSTLASTAVVCFVASRWLSHFIYKNFYYHDYNHALK